jgi:GTP-binding protein
MKFVDYVTITVRSGNGGAGAVAFRREKYVPRGGPNGGDGGDGGSIIVEADQQLYTLLDLRYHRHHYADNGAPGGGSNKKGADGADIVIRVPVGTVVSERATGETLVELVEPGQRSVLARGGMGGKGNAFFKSATHQTPRFAQDGIPGEELEIVLELKLLADVGLVGFPNAGKSTLVAAISAAKPKIADYPFTTLQPTLGVVQVGDYQSFVIADIPGLIEGAHEGKGLGTRFLRHIERNAVLLFTIPVDEPEPAEQYSTLKRELVLFEPELAKKPYLVAVTKMDLVAPDKRGEKLAEIRAALGEPEALGISSVARIGLDEIKTRLWAIIQTLTEEKVDAWHR